MVFAVLNGIISLKVVPTTWAVIFRDIWSFWYKILITVGGNIAESFSAKKIGAIGKFGDMGTKIIFLLKNKKTRRRSKWRHLPIKFYKVFYNRFQWREVTKMRSFLFSAKRNQIKVKKSEFWKFNLKHNVIRDAHEVICDINLKKIRRYRHIRWCWHWNYFS